MNCEDVLLEPGGNPVLLHPGVLCKLRLGDFAMEFTVLEGQATVRVTEAYILEIANLDHKIKPPRI